MLNKKAATVLAVAATLTVAGCGATGVDVTATSPTATPTTQPPTTVVEPDVTYTPPVYDCDEAEDEAIAMAMEQHTSGPLIVGIKNVKVLEDNQPTLKANGWVLKCGGKSVVSGMDSGPYLHFGYRMEGGDMYVSIRPQV